MVTFTAFASEGVVVVTGGSIAAHQTQFFLLPGYGSFLLFGFGETVDRIATAAASDAAVDAAGRRQILSTYKINDIDDKSFAKKRQRKMAVNGWD